MGGVKRILLLGSNGQLGSDLVEVLAPSSALELISLRRSDIDVEKIQEISQRLNAYTPFDILINGTAYNKTDECEKNPLKAFTINALAPLEMARFCRAHDATFIHISTDYVFSGEKGTPYLESDLPDPLSVYGVSKLAGEKLVAAAAAKFFIFRVASLFGKAGSSGKGGNFVETMIQKYRSGEEIRVVDDITISPTHTLDAARVIKTFIEERVNQYGLYHCVNSGGVSWYGFAKKIFEYLRTPNVNLRGIKSSEFQTPVRRPKYSVLDTSKVLCYAALPSWEEALKEYLVRKSYLQ